MSNGKNPSDLAYDYMFLYNDELLLDLTQEKFEEVHNDLVLELEGAVEDRLLEWRDKRRATRRAEQQADENAQRAVNDHEGVVALSKALEQIRDELKTVRTGAFFLDRAWSIAQGALVARAERTARLGRG